MTDFTLRPLTVPERKYTYAQSSQLQGQTGNIGYLRGDFGSSGDQFYTTWFDTRPQWKSDAFKRDLDDVINALRSEEYGLLQSRSQMVRYGRENKESEMQGAYTTEFGFRADTEKYAFVLRCNPTRGDYNFYCLCYVKEWLDKHIEEANRDIRFIDSHYISSRTESHSETVITETDDGNGNIVQTETTETRTTLYITVSHKTVEEMADQYGFNEEQREYLAELLEDKNNSLWAAVLYGIRYSDDQIVTVALSQVGNVGGEPYWSWYGFGSRVEWCACFVSWCANECGYIETGVIPKFAGCVNGVQWFKDRGQWMDGSAEPVPGMIIFFDWDNKGSSGPQDGLSDHVGIVPKVENGII